MTMEFKQRLAVEIGIEMARLSPWQCNLSMCLRPVTADKDAEEGAARGGGGEDEELAFDPDDDPYALLMETEMETWKTMEKELQPCRSRQKWLMQSSATGLRSKARQQHS